MKLVDYIDAIRISIAFYIEGKYREVWRYFKYKRHGKKD
jgi:hypothetical protein